jgi:hypothetical protein
MSTSDKDTANTTVICTYRVKAGKEKEFIALLGQHWPTLNKLDLVSKKPSQIFQGKDKSGGTFFVEVFTWKDAESVSIAHDHPAVLALWEPMGKLCEERIGQPAMEFPHVRPIQLTVNASS